MIGREAKGTALLETVGLHFLRLFSSDVIERVYDAKKIVCKSDGRRCLKTVGTHFVRAPTENYGSLFRFC